MSGLFLVIDDEPDLEILFRQQFRKELRTGCFYMEFVLDAESAIARIGNCADVNLILSDVNMPGLGGFDLLKRARKMRPDVPVIMITAYGDAETERNARVGGAEGFLAKPIESAILRAEIFSRLDAAT